jgi:hypothetical protein
MNRLFLAVLTSFVALACSSSNIGSRNTNIGGGHQIYAPALVVANDDPSVKEINDMIGSEMKTGEMTQEDAFRVLNIALVATTPTGEPLQHKFFPISSNFVVTGDWLGGLDNCAYTLPYSWNIDCDVSGLVDCKIAVTITDHGDPLYGTWVFWKPCDGQPIGNWSLFGLTVNYTGFTHIQ